MRISQSTEIILSEIEIEYLKVTDKILKEIQTQLKEGEYMAVDTGEIFDVAELGRARGILDAFTREYLFEKR
jgi:hypothetical protein